jgi:uncharacterized membrane protein
MSAPYNPAPGGHQSGDQPSWSGYPGSNYPQQNQPGYGGSEEYQQGGYGQGGYSQPGSNQYGGYQPSGYQQGGYQQPSYSQQQGGYGYGQGYGSYSQPRQTFGIVGLIVAVVGAAVLISGFFLSWYKVAGQEIKFSDIHKDLNAAGSVAPALPKAYFGWLAWVLLALVIITAVLANLPIGSSALIFRIVAPIVGLAGVLLTLLALNSYFDKAKDVGATDVGIFKHSAIGLYLTLAGFVIAGVAGVFGPRRA